MRSTFLVPDRRLPFMAVLGDCLACALAFPIAARLVPPAMIEGAEAEAALAILPLGLVIINVLVVLLDPPEPLVWSIPRAVLAGVWRATLLFICLLWTLIFTGHAGAVPVGLFMVAWGCLVGASAVLRVLRLLLAPRLAL